MNGELADLSRPLDAGLHHRPHSAWTSPEGLEIMRHSAAHVMAEAVRDLFPGGQGGHRPGHRSGFYYDFDVPEPFTPEDLEKIEAHMAELAAQNLPFRPGRGQPGSRRSSYFQEQGEAYKVELLEDDRPRTR